MWWVEDGGKEKGDFSLRWAPRMLLCAFCYFSMFFLSCTHSTRFSLLDRVRVCLNVHSEKRRILSNTRLFLSSHMEHAVYETWETHLFWIVRTLQVRTLQVRHIALWDTWHSQRKEDNTEASSPSSRLLIDRQRGSSRHKTTSDGDRFRSKKLSLFIAGDEHYCLLYNQHFHSQMQ